MADERSFLGRGWGFPPTFDRSEGGVEMVSGDEDVRSSLEVLLSTTIGERRMQPRYGCKLDRLIFEPADITLRAYIKDLIRTAILYFEPRVILDDVLLHPDSGDEGRIDIHVVFKIAETNTRYNFVYPFYKREGSGLRP